MRANQKPPKIQAQKLDKPGDGYYDSISYWPNVSFDWCLHGAWSAADSADD
jgi:hypothetical protein